MTREPQDDPHYDEYREETNRYRRPIKRNYDRFYPDAYFEADNTPDEEVEEE